MHQQIVTMLTLQDEMNTKVHSQWREQGFDWYRAIWTECAELMDHYGWKWWKKQQPDVAQVQLELIDIWHFGLSILLLEQTEQDAIAEKIIGAMAVDSGDVEFRQALEAFTLKTLETKSFDMAGFKVLMQQVDMTFEQLYTQYVGKNVLNIFRQDFGYQDGSYHKQWQGKEDNEHLVDIIASLDHSAPDFQQNLYQKLEKTYLELTAS